MVCKGLQVARKLGISDPHGALCGAGLGIQTGSVHARFRHRSRLRVRQHPRREWRHVRSQGRSL